MSKEFELKECVVVGAGISGIALARWLKEYKLDYVIVEKSNDICGLWRFKQEGYGVMSFTHINVSKYNYCFSDYPFPDEQAEFMHHEHIYKYVKSYCDHHSLFDRMLFEHQVVLIEEIKTKENYEFASIRSYDKLWRVTCKTAANQEPRVFITPYVAVCTGHHATPRFPEPAFPGQDTFKGQIIHSVKYKDSIYNNMAGKRVCLVGIGNSSVDVADNLVTQGNCPNVTISARTGVWVFPTYLSGIPIDLFANRMILSLPWKLASSILEAILMFVNGPLEKINLKPKIRVLQSHLTVSPTLMHHCQRKRVTIQPNIKMIRGNEIEFENGKKDEFDAIILCTGYKIDLSFLHSDIRKLVFQDPEETFLNLYKLMFHPKIGRSLSFIGFVQPQTGGILPISEIQARWLVYLMTDKIKLPSEDQMYAQIESHTNKLKSRYYKSSRHTIQEDPLNYNDEVAEFFGAKPSVWRHPSLLAWRYLFSSGGPAQWRLDGIDADPNAEKYIRQVPVPPMHEFLGKAMLFLLALIPLLLLISIFFYPSALLFILPCLAIPFLMNLKR